MGRRDPHRLLLGPPGGGEPAAVGVTADAAQLAGEQGACALHLHRRHIRFASPGEGVVLQQRTPLGLGVRRAQAQVVQQGGDGKSAVHMGTPRYSSLSALRRRPPRRAGAGSGSAITGCAASGSAGAEAVCSSWGALLAAARARRAV